MKRRTLIRSLGAMLALPLLPTLGASTPATAAPQFQTLTQRDRHPDPYPEHGFVEYHERLDPVRDTKLTWAIRTVWVDEKTGEPADQLTQALIREVRKSGAARYATISHQSDSFCSQSWTLVRKRYLLWKREERC